MDLERERRIVEQVNEGFYRAFESGRIEDMERVWSCTERDRCIHPGWPILVGWEAIRPSWLGIFQGTSRIHIQVERLDVQLTRDLAWVTCIERFSGFSGGVPVSATVVATNLFERMKDRWVLVHHHGSPLAQEPEASPEPKRMLH